MHIADEEAVAGIASDPDRIEAVHRKNAARLGSMMDQFGWPGRLLVGEGGMRAAWRIAMHSIYDPALQYRAMVLLKQAVAIDDAPAWQAAMLEDRVCRNEGRPQIYGTQLDWDIADPGNVDQRRNDVGLMSMAMERRARQEKLGL